MGSGGIAFSVGTHTFDFQCQDAAHIGAPLLPRIHNEAIVDGVSGIVVEDKTMNQNQQWQRDAWQRDAQAFAQDS